MLSPMICRHWSGHPKHVLSVDSEWRGRWATDDTSRDMEAQSIDIGNRHKALPSGPPDDKIMIKRAIVGVPQEADGVSAIKRPMVLMLGSAYLASFLSQTTPSGIHSLRKPWFCLRPSQSSDGECFHHPCRC